MKRVLKIIFRIFLIIVALIILYFIAAFAWAMIDFDGLKTFVNS